uniref:Uncharacterized protein n=1 Tax=Molossus molossus TaxID=27622 RepID=A0A7J8HDT2_MOLMO|nr:hypothetical protein HJG59_011198 [Molossus molossus]
MQYYYYKRHRAVKARSRNPTGCSAPKLVLASNHWFLRNWKKALSPTRFTHTHGISARIFKVPRDCLAGVAQGLSVDPCTQRSVVRFPVGTHAQVLGLILSGAIQEAASGCSLIDVFISLSLPLSLKSVKEKKKT